MYPDCTAANSSMNPACMAEYCMSMKDDLSMKMQMVGGDAPHAAAAAAAAGMAMSSTVN